MFLIHTYITVWTRKETPGEKNPKGDRREWAECGGKESPRGTGTGNANGEKKIGRERSMDKSKRFGAESRWGTGHLKLRRPKVCKDARWLDSWRVEPPGFPDAELFSSMGLYFLHRPV